MKYLTFNQDGVPTLIAFTSNLSHAQVARSMGIREVRSAGFICRTSDGMFCHGASESLKVGSLVSDSKLASFFFQ